MTENTPSADTQKGTLQSPQGHREKYAEWLRISRFPAYGNVGLVRHPRKHTRLFRVDIPEQPDTIRGGRFHHD